MKLGVTGIFLFSLSMMFGKKFLVSCPFIDVSHSLCHISMFVFCISLFIIFLGTFEYIIVFSFCAASFAKLSAISFP